MLAGASTRLGDVTSMVARALDGGGSGLSRDLHGESGPESSKPRLWLDRVCGRSSSMACPGCVPERHAMVADVDRGTWTGLRGLRLRWAMDVWAGADRDWSVCGGMRSKTCSTLWFMDSSSTRNSASVAGVLNESCDSLCADCCIHALVGAVSASSARAVVGRSNPRHLGPGSGG